MQTFAISRGKVLKKPRRPWEFQGEKEYYEYLLDVRRHHANCRIPVGTFINPANAELLRGKHLE